MKKLLLICALFLKTIDISSQDIKGAYIKTAWIPNFNLVFEYTYTLTLLTDPSINIPRPTVTLYFGDNTSGSLPIISTTTSNGTAIKTYTGSHIYSGSSGTSNFYQVVFIDSLRVIGIENISNSHTQPIMVESRIFATNDFMSRSSGAITNFPPVLGVSGNNVVYDPMFVKGFNTDSVVYSIQSCYASSYYLPNNAVLNYSTGVLSFPKDSLGLYAFYLRIAEWGKNVLNNYSVNRVTYVDFAIDVNSTVGINNNLESSLLKIYPNPANESIFIELIHAETALIEIMDISGRVCGTKTIAAKDKMETNELANGLYIYKISNSSGLIKAGSIIINR